MTKLDYEILLIMRLFGAMWTFEEINTQFPRQRRGVLLTKITELRAEGLLCNQRGRYFISREGENLLDEIARNPWTRVNAHKWIAAMRSGFNLSFSGQNEVSTAAIPAILSDPLSYEPSMEEIIDMKREIDVQ